LPHELDGFMWFCEECDNKLYEEHVYVDDIVAQLPPIFDRFYSSEKNRRCDKCGAVAPEPAK
jgi:3-hydroxyanthranilate 3,4-dioxygenase